MDAPQMDLKATIADGDYRCCHMKSDGSRCGATRLSGSLQCFFHDPETREEHRAATSLGGRNVHRSAAVLPASTPDLPLKSVRDVASLLAETIYQVRKGDLDPKIANAVGYLSGHLMRSMQLEDLERRLLSIERQVQGSALVPPRQDVFCESSETGA